MKDSLIRKLSTPIIMNSNDKVKCFSRDTVSIISTLKTKLNSRFSIKKSKFSLIDWKNHQNLRVWNPSNFHGPSGFSKTPPDFVRIFFIFDPMILKKNFFPIIFDLYLYTKKERVLLQKLSRKVQLSLLNQIFSIQRQSIKRIYHSKVSHLEKIFNMGSGLIQKMVQTFKILNSEP